MTQESSKPTADSQAQSSRGWETLKILVPSLITALVPSLITALVGFVIWNAQTKIQHTVDKSNQLLQTQLALKEEFYKRRLTIYENTCKQIAETKTALDQAGATPDYETQAVAMVAELDKLRKVNMLYWSPDLEKRLGNLWWLGINKLRNKKFEDDKLEETLVNEISQLHTQMKQDLQLSEIARILQEVR